MTLKQVVSVSGIQPYKHNGKFSDDPSDSKTTTGNADHEPGLKILNSIAP